eukprot:TRINITY_DN9457_c0_g12_i1.p3 TRINITY_DN9457_c0_g12~~TRINITY_DN9457_c0_g12_i1.p3  ORF type:complete len:467 (+),score=212.56 TRINITY_DN9457_c0_g12_i1:83-1402(+)
MPEDSPGDAPGDVPAAGEKKKKKKPKAEDDPAAAEKSPTDKKKKKKPDGADAGKEKKKEDKKPVVTRTPTEAALPKMKKEELVAAIVRERGLQQKAADAAAQLQLQREQHRMAERELRKHKKERSQTAAELDLLMQRTDLEREFLAEAFQNTKEQKEDEFCKEICDLERRLDMDENQWYNQACALREDDIIDTNQYMVKEEDLQCELAEARARAEAALIEANRAKLEQIRRDREEQKQDGQIAELKRELRKHRGLPETDASALRDAAAFMPQRRRSREAPPAGDAGGGRPPLPSPRAAGSPPQPEAQRSPPPPRRRRKPGVEIVAELHAAVFSASKPTPGEREAERARSRNLRTIRVHKNPDNTVGLQFLALRVTGVPPGGPADRAGLKKGMGLVEVDGVRVRSDQQAIRAFQSAPNTFTVVARAEEDRAPARSPSPGL